MCTSWIFWVKGRKEGLERRRDTVKCCDVSSCYAGWLAVQNLRIIPFWTFVLDVFSAIRSAGNSEITDTETRTEDGLCMWVCVTTLRLIASSNRTGGLDLLGVVKLMKGVRALIVDLKVMWELAQLLKTYML